MIYNNIRHDIINCQACPLYQELDYDCTPQWGMGSKIAKILVINLRSSGESHLLEKPLETKYSLLLKNLLSKAAIAETDVFVTNLVKCKCNTTPAKPFKANLAICKNMWLSKEVEALPTIQSILLLGQQTAKFLEKDVDPASKTLYNKRLWQTHSLDETFRKGQKYMDEFILTLKSIKDSYVQNEVAGR